MKIHARILVSLAAVLMPPALLGQAVTAQPQSKKPAKEEKVVQIRLHPTPEPEPALRYELLPPFLERRPGNAAVWWNRLAAGRYSFLANLYAEGSAYQRIEQWKDNMTLGDPREKAYREKELAKDMDVVRTAGGMYADMERAARFDSCDWQLPVREGNPIEMLIPEAGASRIYSRLLASKTHLEIAEGKYDQAVRTLQTGYALGRHIAQGPILINALVGVAIAETTSEQVQQFIQQPAAPNLYWALATLPRPLIDFRLAFEAERNFVYLCLPELKQIKGPGNKNISPEQWRELLHTVMGSLMRWGGTPSDLGQDAAAATAALAFQAYPVAKQHLIEQGALAAEVEAMPVAKVVLLDAYRSYERLGDEHFKWVFLPYPEFEKGYARAESNSEDVSRQEIIPIARMLLPALRASKTAETRLQWNLAQLQIFEALRMYAAAHDGRLPERLSDVTEVPIPVNPFDDKPFTYQREGNRAVLSSEHGPPSLPWRYEITMLPNEKGN